jgi:tripartite-type tricarboxylate transporter receptor subunit TctC
MYLPRRSFLSISAIAVALLATHNVNAQIYPTRPITMVVPFAPGGSTDVTARTIVDRMRQSLGQAVIIENVAGAGGTLGVGKVARATPHGYTIVIGQWSTHMANGAVYTLQYAVVNDFAPVSVLADMPLVITAKKNLPASNLKEFIVWLKANPGRATQGHSGAGNTSHVAGVLFQQETGTHFQSIPYRGGGPVVQDLVAGHIDFGLVAASDAMAQVRSGNIKVYAVTGKTRLASAPDIPTVDEAGLAGLYFSLWQGVWAPRGTPRNVIDKLNNAVVNALADASVRSRLADIGVETAPRDQQTPEARAGPGNLHRTIGGVSA